METITIKEIMTICKRRCRATLYSIMKNHPDFPKRLDKRGRAGRLLFDRAEFMAWFEQHKDKLMEDLKHAAKGK